MEHSRPADRLTTTLLVAAGIIATAAHAISVAAADVLAPTGDALLAALYPIPYAAGALLCFLAARQARWAPERHAWRLFGCGIATVLVAMVVVIVARRVRHPALFVVGDLLALAYYGFAAAGFLALTKPRLTTGAWRRSSLDLAVVASAVMAIAAFVWLRRIERDGALLHHDDFLYDVATPAAASIAAVAAAMLILIGRHDRPIGRRLSLVIAAVSIAALGDVLTTLYHGVWSRINPVVWTLTCLTIGLAAAWGGAGPLGASVEGTPTRATLVRVPYLASLTLALFVLAELPGIGHGSHRALVLGIVVVTGLVVVRQVMSLRENRALAIARVAEAARFRALVQRSTDAFVVCGADGIMRFHSPALAPMLGAPGASLTGSSLLVFAAEGDRERLREALGVAAAASARELFTVAFETVDGAAALEAVVSNRSEDEQIAGLVLNVRDVTDRRRLERQLQQSQKLEALGRLAGGVAHDFNNLIAAIIGFADLVERGLADGTARAEDARGIRDTAQRAASLTQQLLAFSRRQPTTPRAIVVDEVVSGMLPLLRQLVGARVSLDWYPDAEGIAIVADPAQLEQVVLNLVVNANDATPRGGSIVVATGAMGATEGDGIVGVRLTVSDDGSGMDEATLARAFEPFFSTKPEGRGTGLGLATVYGVVTQSGGRVVVDSAPGEGTTVSIELPLRAPRRVSTDQPPAQLGALAGA